MVIKNLFLLSLCLFLLACNDDDDKADPSSDISYSEWIKANDAKGSIDHQNAGPKRTLGVTAAFLRPLPDNQFQFVLKFHTLDSLQLIIRKATQDYNYHYPKPASENQLLFAIYNLDTLDLKESALSLQPRASENAYHTVTNLHTLGFGDFNGTVNGVPLVNR